MQKTKTIESLVVVHTHTHTGFLDNNKIIYIVSKTRLNL